MGSIFASKFISQEAMSAINLVSPFPLVVIAISVMFATGANAIIAKQLGEGNADKARQNFTVIMLLGISVGALLTILTLIFDKQIIHALGSTAAFDEYAEIYIDIYSLAFIFVFLQMFSNYFFVTIGKPIIGMSTIIVGGLTNILLNYLLVAKLNIGMVGIGIALFVGFFIPALFFLIYFSVNKNESLFFVKPVHQKRFILDTCVNGSSEMVSNLAVAVITFVFNNVMYELAGNDGVAAAAVIVQVKFLLNSLYIGFGAGVAPIFSFAYGQSNEEQTKNVFKLSTIFVVLSSLALVVLCLSLSPYIVGLFIATTSSAFKLSQTGFIIFSFGYLFAGFNIYASVFFTSVSNGKISALISFLRTFVFVLILVLVLPKFMGTTGVWLSIPIAECLGAIVSLLLLKRYRSTYHY